MAPHSSTLAWKIPWAEEPGRLQSMGLLRVGHDWATSLSLFLFHALEKEMATHSSVLAWRIPGAVEPGGLMSMGSHRVGHDWSDLAVAAEPFNFSFFSITVWGIDLDYCDIGLPWKQTEIILSFLTMHPSTAFQTLLLTMMATPFLLKDSCPQ